MDATMAKFPSLPSLAIKSFAVIGFVFLGSKIISYTQMLMSLFVLSGKNVSLNSSNPSNSILILENS